MRLGLLGVRISILLVNLAIVAIIVLSVLPLASGGLRIDLPQNDLEKPTFEDNVVKFSLPVDIYNGGYFDITDFRMNFKVSNGDYLISEHSSVPVDIVTGRTNHINLDLELDLNEVPPAELKKLVFESMTLNLEVGVEGAYSLGLVKASVHTNQSMDWEPLISDLMINTGGIQTEFNGTDVDVLVPYSFSASDMVTGNTIGLQATLSNSTSLLGSATQSVTLQSYNQGQLRFTISQETAQWLMSHPEDLIIGTDLTFEGVSVHQDSYYHWGGMP